MALKLLDSRCEVPQRARLVGNNGAHTWNDRRPSRKTSSLALNERISDEPESTYNLNASTPVDRSKLVFTLTGQSEEIAMKTAEFLEGVIAYEKLCAAGSDALLAVMENVQLERRGKESIVRWQSETQMAIDAVRDLLDRIDEWIQAMSG